MLCHVQYNSTYCNGLDGHHACHVGPAPAFLVSAVLKGGKKQKNGKKGFLGAIRHSESLQV